MSVNRELSSPSTPIIVGVGASAGGMDAFQELLRELGDAHELAIIYVQHLEKGSEQLLSELLRKATLLPVKEIDGRCTIKARTIYICPPWKLVELKGNVATVVDGDDTQRPESPIDFLLNSLGDNQGERGVGVILSGTGSDGTLGLKAISDAGGMTFSQSPESAKFDSMPRSAATTGVADYVLTPAEIASELKKYATYLSTQLANSQQRTSLEGIHEALPEISRLLMEATKHNFQHYKPNTLARRILRRMRVLKLANVETYIQTLEEDPREPQALFRELLISVTAFFRDPEAFRTLETLVIPKLFANRPSDEVIRIWVPGCASGEEAFSIAMLCLEQMDQLEASPEVQIFATDIDQRALAIARQATYPIGIEEDISEERLKRFFIKRGKKYQLAKEVRELVLFSAHNLISDPPFSRLDFISCRNLLIYLGPHLQKKLIPLFHYSLRPSGFLMLGPSESISSHGELFRMIDARYRISQRKATGVDAGQRLSLESDVSTSKAHRSSQPANDPAEDLIQIMQRIVLDEFSPKSVIVEESGKILCASADMHKYLTVGTGNFENNVIKLARQGLRVGLRATLQEAKQKRRRVVHDDLSVRVDGKLQRVMLTVQPMPRIGEDSELFMVVFHDIGLPLVRGDAPELTRGESGPTATLVNSNTDSIIAHLERELASTRNDLEKSIQELETTNEELKSSNEELLSLNEEMQSANEELETSKEEIQAAVNALGHTNSDLENLLRSTRIATIFLDDQLRIRSFTPAATAIYGLIATDVGRPLAHLMPLADNIPPLPDPHSVTGSEPIEDTIQTRLGRWYLRRVLPYQSQRGERDGIVVTFLDITERKVDEQVLQQRADLAALHSNLALSLGSEAPLNDILQKCCQHLVNGLNAAFVRVWLFDSEERILNLTASAGMYTHLDGSHSRIPLGKLKIGRIAALCEPVQTNEVSSDPNIDDHAWAEREGMKAFAGYPLVVENRLRGVVALFAKHELTPQVFEQLFPMADAIAQCVARKHSEHELKDREAHLRRVIDNTLCFIGILDSHGVMLEVNEAALLAGGLSREDVFGKPFWDCYWWSHDEQTSRDLKAAVATALQGEVVRYDVEVRMAGDTRLMIDFMLAPVKDTEGRVAYLIPSGVDISERKWAERELQQRVKQLQLSLDTGRMGIWEWDVTNDCVSWSSQLFDMFGYSEETFEPTKAGFLKVVHPHDRELLEQQVKAAFAGEGDFHEIEFRIIRGDTNEIEWLHCRGTTVRDSKGEPRSFLSVAIDVTARKRRELSLAFLANLQSKLTTLTSAEAIVKVASKHVAEFLQLSHFLLCEIDEEAQVAHVVYDRHADGVMELTGSYPMVDYASEEERRSLALGHLMIVNDTATPARDRKTIDSFANLQVGAIINAPCTRNQRLEFMFSAIKPSAHIWREDEILLLRELSTILRLKLERVKAEVALRESEAKFRDLADNMSQFAWMADSEGSIIWYNQRWFDYTGTTMEEMQGWGWKSVHHPDHVDRVAAKIQYAWDTGEVWEDTFPLRSKDGEYRWFLSRAQPIRDEHGTILRWFGTNTDITETKNAEYALRSSEEQLRLGIEVAKFSLARIDYPSGAIHLTPEAARLYGFASDALIKSREEVHATFHPEDRDELAGYIHDVLSANGSGEFACEHRVVLPSGDTRWLNVRKRVFFDRSVTPPQPTHGILAAQDITEQMHWELALAESKERLSMAMESAQMGTFEWEPETDHSIWDEQHLALTGLTSESFKGSDFFSLIHPDDTELNRSAIADTIGGSKEYVVEFRIKRPDGKTRWLAGRGKIVRANGERPMRFIGLNWDITEAKEQEQRIRESEERLRSAAQAAGFGTVHVDLLTGSATFSNELRKIIGLQGDEQELVPTHKMPEWIHFEDRDAFAKFIRQLSGLEEGSTSSIDLRIVRPDDEVRWARLQAKPVYTGIGLARRPTQVIGTVLDITKQREFEQSLNESRALAEAANESKSAFLANMSHEIRTPMTAILGYTDLLADRVQDEEAVAHLRTIRRNGYFLLDIINDILDLSKIEAGMMDVASERFAPDQLVEDVRSIMEVRAIENQLTLDVEYRGLIPALIESDGKRLKQILINLVGNAIKFTKKGSVLIVVSYGEQKLQIKIIDTGIGMSQHQQKRLFQPFSQGDHTVNREFGGTGLGLAISQRLAAMLGGNIDVKSEKNRGSTFTVTIATGNITNVEFIHPLLAAATTNETAAPDAIRIQSRILVVDDRRDIRFLSRRFLSEVGATVTEAEDGEVAIKTVTQAMSSGDPFDLIILDMQMPKLDGYETARQLRRIGFRGPIIALTADAMQGDMSRCIESGCNDYLSKPIDKMALLKMVSSVIAESQ